MNKLLPVLLLVSFIVVLTALSAKADAPAAPAPAMASPAEKSKPHHFTYLTGKEELWDDFPKAPALGSPIDEEDLAITLVAQAYRTDDQKNQALLDQHYSILLIAGVIDPAFDTKYPATYAVLQNAGGDAGMITEKLKKANKRLRPLAQHPMLVVPLFNVEDFSYPSGHASGAQLQARILGVLFPDRAEDLLKRARQIADSRVVAGAHYASDTEAGQNLGDLVFGQLEANSKFKQDLAAAAQKDGITLK